MHLLYKSILRISLIVIPRKGGGRRGVIKQATNISRQPMCNLQKGEVKPHKIRETYHLWGRNSVAREMHLESCPWSWNLRSGLTEWRPGTIASPWPVLRPLPPTFPEGFPGFCWDLRGFCQGWARPPCRPAGVSQGRGVCRDSRRFFRGFSRGFCRGWGWLAPWHGRYACREGSSQGWGWLAAWLWERESNWAVEVSLPARSMGQSTPQATDQSNPKPYNADLRGDMNKVPLSAWLNKCTTQPELPYTVSRRKLWYEHVFSTALIPPPLEVVLV